MRPQDTEFFVSPVSHAPLSLRNEVVEAGEVVGGVLVTASGESFVISNGIPDLHYPKSLTDKAGVTQAFYDSRSETYDQFLHLTFLTHRENEKLVRNKFVDALELKENSRVLEVGAGTGRDSEIIASRLGEGGSLCLQDIAEGMLRKARERLREANLPVSYCLSNAAYLPFKDRAFDCVYSFGGLGEFPDIKRSLAEMVRVCRPGGKIVVGDESIPPWLRDTEFAAILSTTNKQFLASVPLESIPVEAREVCLRWVIGGVFYLLDFKVGEGEPTGEFDFDIPGPRGGTYRTRYLGQLEGVSPEAKRLAELACQKRGVSLHKWLDDVVREAATNELDADES